MADGVNRSEIERRRKPRRNADHQIIPEEFAQCPRWDKHELTDEQIMLIAEKAADVAAQKALKIAEAQFYTGVGKRVVRASFYIIGVIAVILTAIATKFGFIKPL